MTQLYRILYCSKNSLSGTPETYSDEIKEILAKSRVNNAHDDLTGGLMFSDGCFAQVLEGPLKMVETTFERIQCDERHHEVTVLNSGPIAAREFPQWSMAFTGADAGGDAWSGVKLSEAFSGATAAGEDVLKMMKQVIVREDDWYLPA
jgi:hypothetical protein